MTDATPGAGASANPGPTTKPVQFEDDGEHRYFGAWNSFQFDPPLTHRDYLKLAAHAKEIDYRMQFRRPDYSLEEIQERLVDEGPSFFLNMTWIQEDISPKEPPKTAEQRMAVRMRKLAPTKELLITDPFLFTHSRSSDCQDYAASVVRMIAPALADGLRITAIVRPAQNNEAVRTAVVDQLNSRGRDLEITVAESDDFHDRFWIADRTRGLVIGTSLNKIGSRIFFVDNLSDSDVKAVLTEADAITAPQR